MFIHMFIASPPLELNIHQLPTSIRPSSVRFPSVLATDCDRRNLLITLVVHCVDSACESLTGGRPAFYRSDDILVLF